MNLCPTRHRELPRLSPQEMPRQSPRARKLRHHTHLPERIQGEILRAGSAEEREADMENQAARQHDRSEVVRVVGAVLRKWA